MTASTADRRGEVSCAVTSGGGWTSTRQTTATTAIPEDSGSNPLLNAKIVAYRQPTATNAGSIACTPIMTAIRKLCLNRTGWVTCASRVHHYDRASPKGDNRLSIIWQFRRSVCKARGQMLNHAAADAILVPH